MGLVGNLPLQRRIGVVEIVSWDDEGQRQARLSLRAAANGLVSHRAWSQSGHGERRRRGR